MKDLCASDCDIYFRVRSEISITCFLTRWLCFGGCERWIGGSLKTWRPPISSVRLWRLGLTAWDSTINPRCGWSCVSIFGFALWTAVSPGVCIIVCVLRCPRDIDWGVAFPASTTRPLEGFAVPPWWTNAGAVCFGPQRHPGTAQFACCATEKLGNSHHVSQSRPNVVRCL